MIDAPDNWDWVEEIAAAPWPARLLLALACLSLGALGALAWLSWVLGP